MFGVLVVDGGFLDRIGIISVIIKIMDINDNKLEF